MRVKKRTKVTRFRGSRTHSRGKKNRTRGSGNQGGVGMAGTGKRGDAKKTLVLKLYGNKYFKKDRSTEKRKRQVVTLQNIVNDLASLVKNGAAKETKGMYEMSFPKAKIIGDTKLQVKLRIIAKSASVQAANQVKEAGGEIVIKEQP